jgi:hypothetical protein
MRVRGEPLVGVLAAVAAVFATAAVAFGPAPSQVLATSASVPGTCHMAIDPDELIASISDTAPAVPCDQPHQTETMWQQPITGFLGQQRVRPNPEILVATSNKVCDDYPESAPTWAPTSTMTTGA